MQEENKFSYRSLNQSKEKEWHFARGLNDITTAGNYAVRLYHEDLEAIGISTAECDTEHYVVAHLVVIESAATGKQQKMRTVGQTLMFTTCTNQSMKIITRICVLTPDGVVWHPWVDSKAGTDYLPTVQELNTTAGHLDNKFVYKGTDDVDIVSGGYFDKTVNDITLNLKKWGDTTGLGRARHTIAAATEAMAGVMSAEDKKKLNNTEVVAKVEWGVNSNINDYTSAGVYYITGKRSMSDDGLPIDNYPYFTARLLVVGSTENSNSITQILSFNASGESNLFMRNCVLGDTPEWSKWGKLQQNTDVGRVASLDNFTAGGVYSGIYTGGASQETFVLTVINNGTAASAANSVRSISQFKYALDLDSNYSYKTRTGRGTTEIEWGDWVDLGAPGTVNIQDGSVTMDKLDKEVKDMVESVGSTMSVNINRTAYNDFYIILPAGTFITDFGDYNGRLLLSPVRPFDADKRIIVSKELLPFRLPTDILTVRPSEDIDGVITFVTGLEGAATSMKKYYNSGMMLTFAGYSANFGLDVSNHLYIFDKGRVLSKVVGEYQLQPLTKIRIADSTSATFEEATEIEISNLPYILPFDVKKVWISVDTISNPVRFYTISAESDEYQEMLQEKRIASLENSKKRLFQLPQVVGDMPDGTVFTLEKNSVRTFKSLAFSADIVSFGEGSKLLLGHGRESEKRYGASWVEIDDTYLWVKTWFAADSIQNLSYEHGLTFSENIQVHMSVGSGLLSVKISSGGASFEKGELEWNCNGTIFAETMGCELSNASLSWSCKNISADIWAFGDSYFGTLNDTRWVKYLLDAGYHNILINGYAGEGSADALADLNALLQHGTPKYIFWCLGMNNADTSTAANSLWSSVLETVKIICAEKDIELVLATIPSVPSRVNKYKNAVVRSSGYWFVDFDKAVGADEETGSWYDGMLSSDGVHPSSKGAVALFHRAIADFPELMMAKGII